LPQAALVLQFYEPATARSPGRSARSAVRGVGLPLPPARRGAGSRARPRLHPCPAAPRLTGAPGHAALTRPGATL